MTTYQEAVLADIDKLAAQVGLPTMVEYRFSNVGRVLIGEPSHIVVTIEFEFYSGAANKLLINGAKHAPPGPDNYYYAATDTERYSEFIARVRALLEAEKV
jgi:hypothetical protein